MKEKCFHSPIDEMKPQSKLGGKGSITSRRKPRAGPSFLMATGSGSRKWSATIRWRTASRRCNRRLKMDNRRGRITRSLGLDGGRYRGHLPVLRNCIGNGTTGMRRRTHSTSLRIPEIQPTSGYRADETPRHPSYTRVSQLALPYRHAASRSSGKFEIERHIRLGRPGRKNRRDRKSTDDLRARPGRQFNRDFKFPFTQAAATQLSYSPNFIW